MLVDADEAANTGGLGHGVPSTWPLNSLRAASPLLVFLAAYAATAVLGNLIYLTPAGSALPGMSIANWEGAFPVELGPGFWLLVALPFFVAAPIAIVVGRSLGRTASWIGGAVPEIPRLPYSLLCLALYAYVIGSLIHAGAIDALLTPTTATDAVRARFALLQHLPFPVTTCLKSLLVFLAVYSIIRANRDRTEFWVVASLLNFVSMVCCLTLLDMKWPAVIFVLCAAVAVFVSARRFLIMGSGIVAVVGVGVYLVLSTFLLHLDTPPATTQTPHAHSHLTVNAGQIAKTAATSIPFLAAAAINRMAIALPFYYAFHDTHPDCPQSVRLLYPKRDLSCEPTLLVYTDIFGNDGFAGKGTAPASVQMYGYALGGWPGALTSLALASIILGLFMSLWPAAKTNSIYAAGLVMGAYTAYNFSQLPIEGPLIYDHGMWWAFLVVGWAALYWIGRGLWKITWR